MTTRDILITASLPYANGPLHLGHIVEYTQADIWTRFQRLQGNTCHYICGSDCHGTPIMLHAEKLGMDPAVMVEHTRAQHQQDFADFYIEFSEFHTTHSPENRELVETIYHTLKDNQHIKTKLVEQAYDAEKNMFLPDRFVTGTCPSCGAVDQYGDGCEVCGATYATTELRDPISVLSGTTPILKKSEHYFFDLPVYEQALKAWLLENDVHPAIVHKLNEWFEQGLQPWDISRDAPYFGFLIPGTKDKYFYVWLDAPIGYMASFKAFCEKNSEVSFDHYWQEKSTAELYHFIGKDVMYFHALFWPALLMGAGFRTPTNVFVHGFLTVNGKKMSKSRGTFIQARTYLNHLNPEYLRYYFAAKLNAHIEDIDLNLDDFRLRVNADLVGKLVNIASRTAGFIHKHFDGQLADHLDHPVLVASLQREAHEIAYAYEKRQFSQAMKLIMRLADDVNEYISAKAPWQLVKNSDSLQAAHAVCTTAINAFRLLMLYLTPVLPNLSQAVCDFLSVNAFAWADHQTLLLSHPISPFKPLLTRITEEDIAAMSEEARPDCLDEVTSELSPPLKPEITFEDFAKVDLRVAKIVAASAVEGADKLVQLTVSLGATEKQIFAGIKKAYAPDQLLGKQVVIVANLKPRKMRFGLSEGMMILAVDDRQDQLFLLTADDQAAPGTPVQ